MKRLLIVDGDRGLAVESRERPVPFIDHLWTVRKGDQIVRAELLQDDRVCQLRFFSEGHWFAAQSYASHEHAVRYADLFQRDLLRAGWA